MQQRLKLIHFAWFWVFLASLGPSGNNPGWGPVIEDDDILTK